MKKYLFLLLLPIIAASCCQEKSIEAQSAKHIILIGSDGFSSDVIRANPGLFKNIEKLMNEGSYTLDRRSVLPSSSAVNWASMLMGAGPEIHGYTTWGSQKPELPSRELNKWGIFPGIFGVLREAEPGAVTAYGYTWDGMGYLYEKDAVNINYFAKDDKNLADTMSYYIKTAKPRLSFVCFAEPDHVGHSIGWGSSEYVDMCRAIDDYVGQIVASVEEASIADKTIIIFTADHGGIGTGHGSITMSEMQCPFVVCGKGINKNHKIEESVMVYDCAATIAKIIDAQQPQVWIGRPVMSVFK